MSLLTIEAALVYNIPEIDFPGKCVDICFPFGNFYTIKTGTRFITVIHKRNFFKVRPTRSTLESF